MQIAIFFYRKWVGKFFELVAGAMYNAEYTPHHTRGAVGVGYMLPMLIEADVFLDHRGNIAIGFREAVSMVILFLL